MNITWDGLLYEIYTCFPKTRSIRWDRGSIIKEYELTAHPDGKATLLYTYKDGYGHESEQLIKDKNVIKKLIPLSELKVVVRHLLWQKIEQCQKDYNDLMIRYKEYDPYPRNEDDQ